jgi:hypothetical protein
MPPKCWFDADHARLVREYDLVRVAYPAFQLRMNDGLLVWEGQTVESPPSVDAPPLVFRVEYPSGFPVTAIKVFPLSPQLPAEEWGHEWHRWPDGRVCIVKPRLWDISYSARDVIAKVSDWYFNYLAYKHKLISKMPDVGRAVIGGASE